MWTDAYLCYRSEACGHDWAVLLTCRGCETVAEEDRTDIKAEPAAWTWAVCAAAGMLDDGIYCLAGQNRRPLACASDVHAAVFEICTVRDNTDQ